MDIYDKLIIFKGKNKSVGYRELGKLINKSEAATRMAFKRKSLTSLEIQELEKYLQKEQPEEQETTTTQYYIEEKFKNISSDDIGIYLIKHHDTLMQDSEVYRKHIEGIVSSKVNEYLTDLLKRKGIE